MPPEPGTRHTTLKVTKATNLPLFDAIVMRNWATGSTATPNPRPAAPKDLQIIGILDAHFESTLSGKTEPARS